MTSQSSLPGETTIVDPGCQIQEELGAILPYLPEGKASTKFMEYARSRGPGAHRANVYSGPSAFPLAEYKKSNGGDRPVLDSSPVATVGADELDDRREEYGIDACVVNPTENLGLSEVNNDRYAVAIAKGYNDWLLAQIDGLESLHGNMLVAPQAPERAADEIDRVAPADGIVGLHLPSTGLTPLPGHQSYSPIYEAAEAHDLPITMYPTVGVKAYHQQYYSSQWFAEDYTYHPSFNHMQNITSLLFEGVPVRYPGLRFVVLGAGMGYAPYLTQRLDDHYLELGYEIPALEKLPSKYMSEHFFWGTEPIGQEFAGGTYLPRMIRMLGVENVLYTSDLPHRLGETPESVYERIRAEFDREETANVLGKNAETLFDL